jgi:hypothetical protein
MFIFLSPGLFGFIAFRRLRRNTLLTGAENRCGVYRSRYLLLFSTGSSQSSGFSISSGAQQVLETDRQNANCREGAGVVTLLSDSMPVLNEGLSQPILSSAVSYGFNTEWEGHRKGDCL